MRRSEAILDRAGHGIRLVPDHVRAEDPSHPDPSQSYTPRQGLQPFVDGPVSNIQPDCAIYAQNTPQLISKLRQDSALVRLMRTAVEQTSDDEGWASLSEVGQYISHNNSSFSSINYGYKKLSDLIKALELFETKKHNGNQLYIKDTRG